MTGERVVTIAIAIASLVLGFKHIELRTAYLLSRHEDLAVYTNQFVGRRIPDVAFPDVVTSTASRLIPPAYGLVFVFSASDCEPCLVESLELLASFHTTERITGSVVGVGHGDTRIELLKLMRLCKNRETVFQPELPTVPDTLCSYLWENVSVAAYTREVLPP